MAAPTITPGKYSISFTNITEDLFPSALVAGTLDYHKVKLFPSAANERLVLREGAVDGPIYVNLLSGDGEGRIDKDLGSAKPYLKLADCTITTSTIMTFMLKNPLQ